MASNTLEDQRRGPNTNKNSLSESELTEVFEILTSERFVDSSPYDIVATLADEGRYICSESTMYRVLRKHSMNAHRGKSKAAIYCQKEPLVASRPNQIWSWDITYLKGPRKRCFYYLYLFLDIFSRKVIGWEIHHNECSIVASDLAEKLIRNESVSEDSLRIHSDNGAPMRGAPMIAVLEQLGVSQSFNRPRVSNDNPYSESLFKTLKYKPDYPAKNFNTIEEARRWVEGFVKWYNFRHKHSQIGYVTPDQKHRQEDILILKNRKKVYKKAAELKPSRFINGPKTFEVERESQLTGYRQK